MSKETTTVVWDWRKADEEKKPSPPSKTKYVIQLAAMAALAALFYFVWHKDIMAYIICGIGALLCAGLLFSPTILRGFDRAGHWLVLGVGTGVTWLLLMPVFYIFFTIGHLMQKLTGKDPLQRKRDAALPSYWNDHDNRNLEARYQKQF